jgi:hypothetical protein
MKNIIRWTLVLAVAGFAAQWPSTLRAQYFPQGRRQNVVLTIHADGRCEVESQSVMSRPMAEQQVRMMEMQQKMEEAAEAGDLAQMAGAHPEANTNALTDEQLKEKYLETMGGRFSGMEEEGDKPMVTVDKDNLTVTRKSSFASIQEMLQNGSGSLSAGVIYFENMRFEQDRNGHLLVTLTPNPATKRSLARMRSEWKLEGLNAGLEFVLPGKVLSSGFPETQTNATWLAVDSKKDESLDALAKLYDGPIVITAESGGLTLKEPLESKNLRRLTRRAGEMGSDLPITEGGAGFVAQAQGIMTTTLHVFPGGENYFKEGNLPSGEQAGTMVHAKLFPPNGRTLQSVTDVKLLKATDDKGRAVAAGENGGAERTSTAYVPSDSGRPQQNNSADVQLRLQLPQPDAQAIDEITAEAVAVTAGSWKEMTLTNITETATNEFDIGAVLPGAKLVISKFSSKGYSLSLQVQIKGPATVRDLQVRVKSPGSEERGYNNSSDAGIQTQGGETTRTLRVSAAMINENGGKVSGPCRLLIRCPQDLRRERVTIQLKGLDLL